MFAKIRKTIQVRMLQIQEPQIYIRDEDDNIFID